MGRLSGERRISSYISVPDPPTPDHPPPIPIKKGGGRTGGEGPTDNSAKRRRVSNTNSAAERQTEDLLRETVAGLRRELVEVKGHLDSERNTVRLLRRERGADARAAREDEAAKGQVALQELKNRNEHEKNIAVATKAEQLEKKFQAEFTKFANSKEEEIRRVKNEERKAREELRQQIREYQRGGGSGPVSPVDSLERFHGGPNPLQDSKTAQELSLLRGHKRRLEEIIQVATESERKKQEEVRQLVEQHEMEMRSVKKFARTEILKLMEELRGKERLLADQEVKIKKIGETEHRAILKEEAAREKWFNAKERRLTSRVSFLQNKLSQTQEALTAKEEIIAQEVAKIREARDREVALVKQEASDREQQLTGQLNKLGEEYDKLKANMVRKLSEAEQSVGPLKSKNRQFVSRNLELTARNKQLQESLRELTLQYQQEREQETQNSPTVVKQKYPTQQAREKRASGQRKTQIGERTRSSGKQQQSDTDDYQSLYTHLQREFTELQRSYQLLQARVLPANQDTEREEKNITYLKNKLQAAETKITDLEKVLNKNNEQSAVYKQLIEEKQAVICMNLGLSEKLRVVKSRETALKAELQDSKDQAELLEFRVLELEEGQEKVAKCDLTFTALNGMDQPTEMQSRDVGTETDLSVSSSPVSPVDSGCSSLHHSRCPSVSTDSEENAEVRRDFRNEKIQETQLKLQALVRHVDGSQSKSLLLQTVALFEALLTRIRELQTENKKLKEICGTIDIKEDTKVVTNMDDDLVFEVETLNQENKQLQKDLSTTQTELEKLRVSFQDLTEKMMVKEVNLEKQEEVQKKVTEMQAKVEDDLKRQVNTLNQKLEATLVGCRSESQMHGESVLKVGLLERSLSNAEQRINDLQTENNELRDQLSLALEQNTAKSSSGSDFGSEPGSTKEDPTSLLSDISGEEIGQKTNTPSSGIGSDLSDSETDQSSIRSRSVSPEKSLTGEDRFTESGIFDSTNFEHNETQKGDINLLEITLLTAEVEKLTTFQDLVETKIVPSSSPSPIFGIEGGVIDHPGDKESTPVNEHFLHEQNMKNKMGSLQEKLEETQFQLKQIMEDKCELEEAENDSRLKAQVLEQETIKLGENIKKLQDELLVESKANKHLRLEVDSQREREVVLNNDLVYLEALAKQYEEKIFKLEESRAGLITGLSLLCQGVTLWSFVHHHKYCLEADIHRPSRRFQKAIPGCLVQIKMRRPAPAISVEDEPFSKKMKISQTKVGNVHADEYLTESLNNLQQENKSLQDELLKLKEEKDYVLNCQHSNNDDKIERIITLEDKVAELFHESKVMKDKFQREKNSLKNNHEKELNEIERTKEENIARVKYFEHILQSIESELENVQSNETEFDSLQKLKYLIDNETKLTKEISEHEKKELAFRETLSEADVIMANIEYNYTSKIKDLEEENNQLMQRISYHNENELRLKQSLKATGKGDYSHLLDRLMETEKQELVMKEKVFFLEKSERGLNLKLLEEQKTVSDLKNEIKDQEDLMAQMEGQEMENKRLQQELNRLLEVEFKYQELMQSEEFLMGRVEELESTEHSLRENLGQCEQMSANKEKRLLDQIAHLEEDIQQQHNSASNYEVAYDQLRGQDDSLRLEVDSLKEKIQELTSELEQKSINQQENELSLRSEVNKARQTLQQTNRQLTEMDNINCQLRVTLGEREEQIKKYNTKVDQMSNQLEQTNIQHEVQLQARDSRLQALQDRLEQRVRRRSDEQELDEMARSEGGILAVTKNVLEASQIVSNCPSCSENLTQSLKEAATQLSTLSSVICGEDSGRRTSVLGELHRCESEEVLTLDEEESEDNSDSNLHLEEESLAVLEESLLESQLAELQEKLGRMESEMTIVSEESKDLQDSLETRQQEIIEKTSQLAELTELVELLTTSTDRERRRGEELQARLRLKDSFLGVFIDLVLPHSPLSPQVVVASLRESSLSPPSVPRDLCLETLCTVVLQNGKHKKPVSDVEMRKLEELKVSKEARERSPHISRGHQDELQDQKINLLLHNPGDFRVTRRVGSDGLLVAWSTPEDDEVTGYLIYVAGRLVQRVRSASRTKALLHNLQLDALEETSGLSVLLKSTNQEEEVSEGVEVVYTMEMAATLPQASRAGRRKTQTIKLSN